MSKAIVINAAIAIAMRIAIVFTGMCTLTFFTVVVEI